MYKSLMQRSYSLKVGFLSQSAQIASQTKGTILETGLLAIDKASLQITMIIMESRPANAVPDRLGLGLL